MHYFASLNPNKVCMKVCMSIMEIEEKTYYPDDEELKKILGWLFRDNIRKIYCPYFLRFVKLSMGLEPTTYALRVRCSTNWATKAVSSWGTNWGNIFTIHRPTNVIWCVLILCSPSLRVKNQKKYFLYAKYVNTPKLRLLSAHSADW